MYKKIKLNKSQIKKFLALGLLSQKKNGNNFFYYLGKHKGISFHLYQNGTFLLQGTAEKIAFFLNKFPFLKSKLEEKTPSPLPEKTANSFIAVSPPYFGCDEAGVGDLFGPLVLTIFLLDEKILPVLQLLDLKDSKKLTDQKIFLLAPKLMQYSHHFATKIVSNEEFNQVFSKMNLKELMSFYYSQMISAFIADKKTYPIVIDGYTNQKNFEKYSQKWKFASFSNLFFVPRAENQYLAVAAASIISRFLFLRAINKISDLLQTPVLLGASNKTKQFLQKMIAQHKLTKMKKFIKLAYRRDFVVTKKQ